LHDFSLVDAAVNVAGRAGMEMSYRLLSKTLGGRVQKDILDSLVDSIGAVLRDRDAARFAYDDVVRQDSIGVAVSSAELRNLMGRVQKLLSSIAELNSIVHSAKARL
jgi:hypothetical protein